MSFGNCLFIQRIAFIEDDDFRLVEKGVVVIYQFSTYGFIVAAGLLTGRYPLRSGIVQAMQAAGDSLARRLSLRAGMGMSNLGSIDMRGGLNMVNGLPRMELTVAELLQQGGFRVTLLA